MKRRTKLGIALAAVMVAVAGAVGQTGRHWVTMPEAELRTALDPELTKTAPVDGSAQARFGRLGILVRRLGLGTPHLSPRTPELVAQLSSHSGVQGEFRKLALEGKVQRPDGTAFPTAYDLNLLAQAFAIQASRKTQAGRSAEVLAGFLTALWIVDQIGETAGSLSDLDQQADARAFVDRRLSQAASTFSRTELARLAEASASMEPSNEQAARAMRRALQAELLPILSDPAAWALSRNPRRPAMRTLNEFLGKDHPEVVTYDARITARNVNRIFVPLLRNALVAPPQRDRTGEKFRATLSGSRTKSPNAFGDLLLSQYGDTFHRYVENRVALQRTVQDSMSVNLATRRYRLAHGGRDPHSAELLVRGGFLTTLPTNFFPPIPKDILKNIRTIKFAPLPPKSPISAANPKAPSERG